MGHTFAFVSLVFIMVAIAAYMIQECLKKWTMTDTQVKKRMKEQDMIEMSELMQDRYYNEEAGKILLPAGV